jgi:ABC-2 type transport system permease protein
MSQLSATVSKTVKYFARSRALLLGIVIWPLALTAIMATTELSTYSTAVKPLAIGDLTIAMVMFAIMLACILNLPAGIARDREIGLLVKLRSMPIKPWVDTLGRLLAYLVFACVVSGLVILLGLGLGAQFGGGAMEVLESFGFLLMAIAAAAGIGLILGSFIKSVQGAAFIGLAVSIVLAYLSGIWIPYDQLSSQLQAFSRTFPISSASSSMFYLLLGQDVAGYDPLTVGQIAIGVVLSVALLAVGVAVYHRTSWHVDSVRTRHILGSRLRKRIGGELGTSPSQIDIS